MRQKIEMMLVEAGWFMVLLVLLTIMFVIFVDGIDSWMFTRWGL